VSSTGFALSLRWLPLRLALRELRGGVRGFGVFIACIALGVAAIAGVGSFAQGLVDGLAREGRAILGGDISFSLIQREARGRDAVLVLEPGRENGDIVSARKGLASFDLRVQGRSAHAGVEIQKGRNAVLELAHQVVAMQALNGTVPGATVNVGVIQGGTRTERVQSIDGRMVPLESVEERVLRDDAGGKVIERIIRRFSAHGDPGPVERERIEQEKHGNETTTRMSRYRNDINGSPALIERSMTQTTQSGESKQSQTVVERPSVNGGLAVAERAGDAA